jgi:two-component system phosphate regulon response regulator OmpR
LRRQAPLPTPGAPSEADEIVSFGPFTLNLGTRELRRDGAAVPMTTGEFGLLKVMAQHPKAPLSRDKLTELARGREHDTFDRAIDVQVSRLRKLLGEDPANPRYIQTVWGRGYVFVPD